MVFVTYQRMRAKGASWAGPSLEDPPMKPLVQFNNTVFTKIIDHKRQIATDVTGRFPVTSNRGNTYLFVLYDYDSNCIIVRPMKSIADIKFI